MKNKKIVILSISIVFLILFFYFASRNSTNNVTENDKVENNNISIIKARPVVISSSCKITDIRKVDNTTYTLISINSNGEVTGPVGAKLMASISNIGVTTLWDEDLDFNCGSWSKEVDKYNNFVTCVRGENQSEKSSWSATWYEYLHTKKDPMIRITAQRPESSPDYPEGYIDQTLLCK